jgi:hypothetical protein
MQWFASQLMEGCEGLKITIAHNKTF